MIRIVFLTLIVVLGVALSAAAPRSQTKPSTPANPVLVFDTQKGTIKMELFASEAPKSVEHVLALMKRSFYRGQRFHRVTASLVQFGDPQSRDMSRRDYWGNGGSGNPIGVFELSKKRTHVRGAVGLAHSGNPLGADSQLYIMKTPSPGLDGKHAIIGRVTVGMAVVDKIAVEDLIKNASVK
jgi:cyclophilin family peptidyl-prolyl cis-trans isomerase